MSTDDVKDFFRHALKGSPVWRLVTSAAIVAFAAGFYWAFGMPPFTGFALAEDVAQNMQKLERRVSGVEHAVTNADLKRERDYLEGRISELGRDIFTVERDILELELKGSAVPVGYRKQLRQMQDDKEKAEERLERLIQANPQLAVRGVP